MIRRDSRRKEISAGGSLPSLATPSSAGALSSAADGRLTSARPRQGPLVVARCRLYRHPRPVEGQLERGGPSGPTTTPCPTHRRQSPIATRA